MPPHILKKVSGEFIPSRCVFVDTEANLSERCGRTGVQEHSLRLGVGVVCYLSGGRVQSRETTRFTRAAEFWSWLSRVRSSDSSTWVFAHNLGYDLTLLDFWNQLVRGPQKLRFAVLEDPPTIIVTSWGRRCVTYVDSLNYWRLPLASIGDSVGLCKLPMPAASDCDSAWFEYCQRDVEVLEKCLMLLISRNSEMRLCSWKPTGPSLAWHAYRGSFLGTKIWMHCNQRAKELERASYYGGRVEARRLGKVNEDVRVLDVNSLYPAVMASSRLPNKLLRLTENITVSDLKRLLRETVAVARCTLRSKHPQLPVPCRRGISYDGRAGDTVLAGDELRDAAESDSILSVSLCAIYSAADLFSGYVKHFFGLKARAAAEGNVADLALAKLMLNSLSGKWAQRGRKWVKCDNALSRGSFSFWWSVPLGQTVPVRFRCLAGKCEELVQGCEPRDSFPAITATIAANARRALYLLLVGAGAGNALYCDTDSVHTVPSGQRALERCGFPFGDQLGALRCVCAGNDAYYWGPRHYRVGSRFVCAQLKPSAVEVADGVYQQDAFAGIESTLSSGVLDKVQVVKRTITYAPGTNDAMRVANE